MDLIKECVQCSATGVSWFEISFCPTSPPVHENIGKWFGNGNAEEIKAQKLMAENKISDDVINQQIAIINSMTKKERADPDIIKASRKIRISNGSGTRVQNVNKLLKQFLQSQKMMKRMQSKGKGGMPNDLLQKLQGNLPPKYNH